MNGDKTFMRKELFHNDRIIFGTNSIFLIKIPYMAITYSEGVEIDWEFAQKEVMSKENKIIHMENERLEIERIEASIFFLIFYFDKLLFFF